MPIVWLNVKSDLTETEKVNIFGKRNNKVERRWDNFHSQVSGQGDESKKGES